MYSNISTSVSSPLTNFMLTSLCTMFVGLSVFVDDSSSHTQAIPIRFINDKPLVPNQWKTYPLLESTETVPNQWKMYPLLESTETLAKVFAAVKKYLSTLFQLANKLEGSSSSSCLEENFVNSNDEESVSVVHSVDSYDDEDIVSMIDDFVTPVTTKSISKRKNKSTLPSTSQRKSARVPVPVTGTKLSQAEVALRTSVSPPGLVDSRTTKNLFAISSPAPIGKRIYRRKQVVYSAQNVAGIFFCANLSYFCPDSESFFICCQQLGGLSQIWPLLFFL